MLNLDPRVRSLEEFFDSGQMTAECRAIWPAASRFSRAIQDGDWKYAENFCRDLFRDSPEIQLKALALQLGAGIAEIRYRLRDRARWIWLWGQCPEWNQDHYARFIRHFQEALTPFFTGSLLEAERRFVTLSHQARQMGYVRGEMRALFHLGLIDRDLNRRLSAQRHFRAALALAETRAADAYRDKIRFQLDALENRRNAKSDHIDPFEKVESLLAQVDAALAEKNRDRARQILAQAEVLRRRLGISRGGSGVRIYFLLLKRAGNHSLATRLSDPFDQLKFLELRARHFGLTPQEIAFLPAVNALVGATEWIDSPTSDEVTFCGISLKKIRHADTAKLIRKLQSAQTSVTKEEICRTIFGLKYDPIVHDKKVYKLIHRAKATFRRPDLFVNTYGGYQLNPRYLGQTQ